jgi:hypothetical protein
MKSVKINLIIIITFLAVANSAFASLSYDVSVDTAALKGSSGYLYLLFNGNPNNTLAASALVERFSTDGSTGARATGISTDSGVYAVGTLPATVRLDNTNTFNDYNQALKFGSYFGFSLILDQTGTDPLAGTTFSMGLYRDALGLTPLKTVDGTLLTVNLNNDGTATTTFAAPGTSIIATPTPVPAAAWLFCSGLMGLAGLRRRMN